MSPKRTTLFELVVLLVIGGLFSWFIAWPKSKSLSEKKLQVDSLRQESAKLNEQQGKLQALVQQLKDSAKDIAKLDESFPLHSRRTWVYLLVENLVQSSGMVTSDLLVSNLEEAPVAGDKASLAPFSTPHNLKKMAVNLGVTGSFKQFEALLKKLENSGRIMDIKTIEVSPSSDNLLDIRLTFDTYYFGASQ
ncbi:MAG: type 4a pilus biogenesis protein PilO [Candidatus Doudnabacteria bacterium]|nr:type 4a pilus biogenesis protein PilO [Candidatus Doudnabacteria bacterium]